MRLTFEIATADVQKLLNSISLDKCFKRKLWPSFRFAVRTSINRNKTQTVGYSEPKSSGAMGNSTWRALVSERPAVKLSIA